MTFTLGSKQGRDFFADRPLAVRVGQRVCDAPCALEARDSPRVSIELGNDGGVVKFEAEAVPQAAHGHLAAMRTRPPLFWRYRPDGCFQPFEDRGQARPQSEVAGHLSMLDGDVQGFHPQSLASLPVRCALLALLRHQSILVLG